MSDLMFEPTGPLQQWQKWANLARLEAIRADKAEALCDTLLSALKAAPSAFGEYDNADDFVWDTYRRWWQGQRQAAIAAVEGV